MSPRTYLLVHGDDFVSVSDEESMFEVSTVLLGPGGINTKEAEVFNRIIAASEGGCTYEVDARRPEFVVNNLELQSAKLLCSPSAAVPQQCEDVSLGHEH